MRTFIRVYDYLIRLPTWTPVLYLTRGENFEDSDVETDARLKKYASTVPIRKYLNEIFYIVFIAPSKCVTNSK